MEARNLLMEKTKQSLSLQSVRRHNEIACLEKQLLQLWYQKENQQQQKIALLEGQLSTANTEKAYLESLLHIRDTDLARYMDLGGRPRMMEGSLQLVQIALASLSNTNKVATDLLLSKKQLTNSNPALHVRQKKKMLVRPYSSTNTITKQRAMAVDGERKKIKSGQQADVILYCLVLFLLVFILNI